MRGVVMHGAGDVRVEDRPDPKIEQPTDAVIRLAATCVCGSDLWAYRGTDKLDGPAPMGHEYAGVNQPVGTDRLAAMQRQQSQQGPLLSAADSEHHAPVRRLKLAEQPHIHCLHPTAPTRPAPGRAAGHQGDDEARAGLVQQSDQTLGQVHA
jgi:Alcohol dehydrogenase GroES-like domain